MFARIGSKGGAGLGRKGLGGEKGQHRSISSRPPVKSGIVEVLKIILTYVGAPLV